MRVALIPQFGTTDDPERFVKTARQRVAEVVPVALLLGGVFIALSPVVGPLLMHGAGSDAKHTATESVALLGVAGICQIWSAVLASVLGAARRFAASALIYLGGSLAMLALAVGLMKIDGVTGASLGVVASAVLLVAAHVAYLSRLGFAVWPDPRALFKSAAWRATARIAGASMVPIVFQLNLTISIAFIAGSTGIVSAYVYAYLAALMVTGVTAATITMVTMPNLIAALSRDGQSAIRSYLTETAAFGTYLYLPVAVGFVCFGHPVTEAVLGGSLSPAVLAFFWDAARIFMVMGLFWAAFAPLVTIAMSQQRYGLMAMTAAVLVPIHVVLVAVLSQFGPLEIVIGHAVSGSLLNILLLVALLRREAPRAAWDVVVSIAPALLLTLAFVVPALAIRPTGLLAALVAIVLCSVVYLALGSVLWPRIGGRMVKLLAGPPQDRPAAPAS
jgi:peptidoglycan biosynthesis protein MviN/MurJ (putative lipid II flippase)